MAITNNNIYSLQLLRNGAVYATKGEALTALNNATGEGGSLQNVVKKDGVAVLARYIHEEGSVKQIRTLVGYYAEASAMTEAGGASSYMTIIDVEGSSADIEELKQKIGTGVTTANTVTKQLQDLSGTTADTSATTSVTGAKKYADEKIAQAVDALDYTDTAATGSYVSAVNEANGVISVTRVALPNVTDTPLAKKFVTEVDQTNGEISVSRGEITSTDKTITLTDGNDGGIDFAVNIDNATIVKDASTGVLSVASTALTQYIGDEDTIHISAADAQNNKTISSPLTISATTPTEANVKEQYNLVGASGLTIGATIKIYKDSALLSVALLHADTVSDPQVLPTYDKATDTWTDIAATAQTAENQALCYAYENVSGDTIVAAVPVGSFINEQEFASGITWDSTEGKVRGVVDSTSEKDSNNNSFLTVGANGFKVDGIKNEIDAKIAALDATGGTTTIDANKHVAVQVVEENGLITAVNVNESNIADADDLADLSAKTVTEIASSNNSISATSTAATDGTVSVDLVTDASKIKMTGFTSTDVLSGITQSSSITEAFLEVDKVITDNEQVVSAALNDLEATKVENINVNGVEGTFSNKVASVTIDGGDIELTGYESGSISTAVVPTDTVNQAIGKLENQIKAAVAGGVQSVVSGDGITVDSSDNNNPVVSVKLADANNITGVAENAIKFNSTDSGLYIDYLDCGTY